MNRSDVPRWRGYIAALTTPFDSKGELDLTAWRELILLSIDQGLHGIVVAGTTGEWHSLTPNERETLLGIAIDEAADHLPIIAGVTAYTPQQVIELIKQAERAGVEGVMFTPPPYVIPTDSEILSFYRTVSDAVSLPILVYNWPRGTGIDIDLKLAQELGSIEMVVGIKDSSPDLFGALSKVPFLIEDLVFFTNFVSSVGLSCLRHMGGDGFIGAGALLGNELPSFFEHIWDDNFEAAEAIALRWSKLSNKLFRSDYGGRLGSAQSTHKAAMNLMGQPGGFPREPYLPLDDQAIAKLTHILEEAGLIPAAMGRAVSPEL